MTSDPAARLFVALDVETLADAEALLDRLGDATPGVKIGNQLFTAAGPTAVERAHKRGCRVFLDLKYHDIPNTVANAVSEACRLGVTLVDVHALGGRAMLQAAAGALPAMGTRLLGITVLTSHDETSLEEIGVGGTVAHSVRRLALLARESGLDGVVASPHEIGLIREACGPDFLIVTPGIRPAGARAGDQARAATPLTALRAGADYLVVGRPVLEADEPAVAARAIVDEMEGGE